MGSLLNRERPPVFCPGCSHERIVQVLDRTFQKMGLLGNQIAIVSDIGCSGLFDTFFHTHAIHGLHGRALTYATGLKLARPELNVIVTMGDGGLGIGGAHFLSACRRNLDITLLVMNNFNFGMTGGQFSATTPADAQVASGFLNRLEWPMDICRVAASAGAGYAARSSCYRKDLAEEIERAMRYQGFSVLDLWGVCTGRYARKNRLTPDGIEKRLAALPGLEAMPEKNQRREYGRHYRESAAKTRSDFPGAKVAVRHDPPQAKRQELIILGNAGQRIITAGEVLCLAGMSAGLRVTQKNEYNITVLRGPAISEIILGREAIRFTGIETPDILLAVGQEGVDRRKDLFDRLNDPTLIICAADVQIPSSNAGVYRVDFKGHRLKSHERALAAIGVLAQLNRAISSEMLQSGLAMRFKGPVLQSAIDLVERASGAISEESD